MTRPTLPAPTVRPRASEDDDMSHRLTFSQLLNRTLSASGGEGTNVIFAVSCVVLFVVIVIMASSGTKDMTSADAFGGVEDPLGAIGDMALGARGGTSSSSLSGAAKIPEIHRQRQPTPSNVNIIIVGDSIARYSYLSLVYFLRWGRWFDPGLEKSNLVNENSFDNPFHKDIFSEFYLQTSRMFQPYELCDCHKNAEHPNMRKYNIENRYYHDPVNRNTVTFLHAYGDELEIHGRLKAEDVYTSRWRWSVKEESLFESRYSKPDWYYDTWDQLFEKYVARMHPLPDIAVLNAGQWSNSFGPHNGDAQSNKLYKALKTVNIKPYWRTTTYDNNHVILSSPNKDTKLTDQYMCDLLGNCLDVSWTKNVKRQLYWDDRHFYEPIYRVMNEDMLESMGYLPEGYVKYDRRNLLQNTLLQNNETEAEELDEEP